MMDEEIRQALSEVREMKKMCGNINMKLTNIVTQRGQNWKEKLEAEYQRGLSEGNDIGYKDGVKDGQNEVWEAVKKIVFNPNDGGLSIQESNKIFGNASIQYVCKNYSASEAIEKLKAYEKKQSDKIEVGDEVEWDNNFTGDRFIVTRIYQPYGKKEQCDGIDDDGDVYRAVLIESLVKTGRHFDIKSILEAMKHD